MCEQTEVEYLDGDVVWVKLGPCWWPGEVRDLTKLPEDVRKGFKKQPLAVVKFFQEDTYEYVKNLSQIYKYNCRKKTEFIKKGLDMHRAKNNFMDKFPDDVRRAEKLTGGDPDILDSDEFAPEEKTNYASIFGSPSPKKTPKHGKSRSTSTSFSHKTSDRSPTIQRTVKKSDYHVSIREQAGATATSDLSNHYTCYICGFETARLNVIIMHHKLHNTGAITTSPSSKNNKSKALRKTKKGKLTFKTTDSFDEDLELIRQGATVTEEWTEGEDDEEEGILEGDEEGDVEKKEKKDKTSTGKRKNNKNTKNISANKKAKMSNICNNLLADWGDSENEEEEMETEKHEEATAIEVEKEMTENEKETTENEKETTENEKETTENEKEEIDKVDKEQQPVTKKAASCFDFEEDDKEDGDVVHESAPGRKIPRVIPPKRRSTNEDVDGDDAAKHEEAFKAILEETAVPELPEETNGMTDSEDASQLPKKKFVRSFEDFENQYNEQRQDDDDPGLEVSKLKSQLKSKLESPVKPPPEKESDEQENMELETEESEKEVETEENEKEVAEEKLEEKKTDKKMEQVEDEKQTEVEPEPEPEAAQELQPEPEPQSHPEQIVETESKLEPEPELEPESILQPEQEPEPVSEPEPEPVSEPVPEAVPEVVPEPVPEPEPPAKTEDKKTEAGAEAEAEAKQESELKISAIVTTEEAATEVEVSSMSEEEKQKSRRRSTSTEERNKDKDGGISSTWSEKGDSDGLSALAAASEMSSGNFQSEASHGKDPPEKEPEKAATLSSFSMDWRGEEAVSSTVEEKPKLLEMMLTDAPAAQKVQMVISGDSRALSRKFDPKTSKLVIKSATPRASKPIILSEKIIRPVPSEGENVSVKRVTSKRSHQDVEDIDTFIIQKPPKREPSPQKPRGRPKIIEQTIIKPATTTIAATATSVQQDDTMFDINSMPIVLSDQIIPGDQVEMSELVTESKKPQKKIQPPTLPRGLAKNQKVYQSSGSTKLLKSSPAVITQPGKPGKFIIMPSSSASSGAQPSGSKYTVGRRVPAKTPKSEPSGNKIMIITNQEGLQQRVLLTPAHQKMLSCRVKPKSVLASKGQQLVVTSEGQVLTPLTPQQLKGMSPKGRRLVVPTERPKAKAVIVKQKTPKPPPLAPITQKPPPPPIPEPEAPLPERPVLALASESADGQAQSYVLVTVDESGNVMPLSNEALMQIDAGSTSLQIDQPVAQEPAPAPEEKTDQQQFIITGDPEATQRFLASLSDGGADLSGLLAGAEGGNIIINAADGQQILLNTSDTDNQILLSVAGDGFALAPPTKNQDILAAALADTDVFQQEAQQPPAPAAAETTTLTMGAPIMTPLEVPSASRARADETSTSRPEPQPALPITITDPAISQQAALATDPPRSMPLLTEESASAVPAPAKDIETALDISLARHLCGSLSEPPPGMFERDGDKDVPPAAD